MRDSSPEQLFSTALSLHQAGQFAQAEQVYRRILELDPDHTDALHFLGVIAFQTGHLEPALDLVRRSVALRPDGAVYHNNLGQILERLGRDEEAERAYSTAIELDQKYAEPCNNLGLLVHKHDELTRAEALYRSAIELDPAYPEPHTNLGNLYKDRGEIDAAIAAYRHAIELQPGASFLHSNLLLTLHYHAAYSTADLAREHRAWAERHVAPLASTRLPHQNDRNPKRRLRIGYVSPDFREHAVARFILPVLQNHDPDEVEIFAYADVARPDAVTESIRAHVHHWRDTNLHSDEHVADLVRSDQIDILIDLAAHSGKNRLLAFARKPAPVQVTWLAYCSTTGVDAIDYRLTDRFLDPPDCLDDEYSESSVYLPGSYWCYSAPPLTDEPAHAGTPNADAWTFGCLNNFAKVTNSTLELWIELLQRVDNAVLVLYAPPGNHRDRVRGKLRSAQLSQDRVSFVSRQPYEDYLRTWQRIDVGLDPLPYCGGTTTCDALWMGVPVVTLAGRTAVSRAGASLLSNVGLADLVTHCKDEYVERAAALIQDRDTLKKMRRELRGQLQSSPVMDERQFTRDLEAALRTMWRTWCERRS